MTDERLAKWRYGLGLLLAFMVGWQVAPEFAAIGWYRPATTILRVLLLLGMGYWVVRQLIEENKKSSENRP